jgi:hypothetical protein
MAYAVILTQTRIYEQSTQSNEGSLKNVLTQSHLALDVSVSLKQEFCRLVKSGGIRRPACEALPRPRYGGRLAEVFGAIRSTGIVT